MMADLIYRALRCAQDLEHCLSLLCRSSARSTCQLATALSALVARSIVPDDCSCEAQSSISCQGWNRLPNRGPTQALLKTPDKASIPWSTCPLIPVRANSLPRGVSFDNLTAQHALLQFRTPTFASRPLVTVAEPNSTPSELPTPTSILTPAASDASSVDEPHRGISRHHVVPPPALDNCIQATERKDLSIQIIRVLREARARLQASRTLRLDLQSHGVTVTDQLVAQTLGAFFLWLRRHCSPALHTYLNQPRLKPDIPGPPSNQHQHQPARPPHQHPHPGPQHQLDSLLVSLYAHYLDRHQGEVLSSLLTSHSGPDLRHPHTWFPFARSIQRRIIYHAGPTNSGKTYNATVALKAAGSGVYCAPLRLLALELYDRLNQDGIRCDMVTGEDVRQVPGARHMACTVEMASINKLYDVAVIDEIQMIGDEARGWAWTRAVLGLAAREVHLCGDDTALSIVQNMCREMGEELQVCRYERATALQVEAATLPGLAHVQPGDCIIVFDVPSIYKYKKMIEQSTKHKVCVVYGALPPETRATQARLFNDPSSGYDVLVATDALGMGLNLNIRRVVFTTLIRADEPLPPTAIKQIAGRAGRRGSAYPVGYVTCLDPADLPVIRHAISTPLQPQRLAGLYPEPQQIELLAQQMQHSSFSEVLLRYQTQSLLGGAYFVCKPDALQAIASMLNEIKHLSLDERLNFCNAPLSMRKPWALPLLSRLAQRYAHGVPTPPPRVLSPDLAGPVGKYHSVLQLQERMKKLETAYSVLQLWIWLSYRLEPRLFPGRGAAREQLEGVVRAMNNLLQEITGTSVPYSRAERGGRPGHRSARPKGEVHAKRRSKAVKP